MPETALAPSSPASGGGPNAATLRFAIAMRGGVSLAVWIGGAMDEIERLRRGNDAFAERLMACLRFRKLEVDILTGASAGGLNAALAGSAIARGSTLEVRDVWLDTADLDQLLDRPSGPDALPMHSLLNGDYFLREITAQLRTMLPPEGTPSGIEGKSGPPVQFFLATTVFGGLQTIEPDDPTFADARREGFFHFRHLADSSAFSDVVHSPDAPAIIGLAARSTASFPGAFDPVLIERQRVAGRLTLPEGADAPAELRMYDGGVVDNIPVARAIRAVAESPAQEAVRRWVLFLHPSPTTNEPPAAADQRPPSLLTVVKDVLGSLAKETLLDDLEVLRRHNRSSESERIARYSLCRQALDDMRWRRVKDCVSPPWGEAGRDHDGLASVDADRLYALLDDPTRYIGWVPIGQNPPASPIRTYTNSQRFDLRMDLLGALTARTETIRPFARVQRLCHLLIEWIREVEHDSTLTMAASRRTVYDVMLLAQLTDARLNQTFLVRRNDRARHLAEELNRVRSNRALRDLVGAVSPPPDELSATAEGLAGSEDKAHLWSRLDAEKRLTLVALARSQKLPERDPGTGCWLGGAPARFGAKAVPADELLLNRLVAVAERLLTHTWVSKTDQPGVFTLLSRKTVGPGDVRDVLLAIDSACAGLHLGRTSGVPMTLDYQRISGAASSPMARGGASPELAEWLPTLATVTESHEEIDPRMKLAGNQLANFSAFVAKRFRANDWMWGRMDAAAGLVDILFRGENLVMADGEGTPRIDGKALAEGVRELITGPFTIDAPVARESAEAVFCVLWTENREAIQRELDATARTHELIGERTRHLIAARWQWEIFLGEVNRVFDAPLHPTDKGLMDPPALEKLPPQGSTLERARVGTRNLARIADTYDRCPRSFGHVWGQRKTTALGVRAARSATKALVPDPGALNGVKRTAIGAPLMIASVMALGRGAFLVASGLLLNVVLAPRLAPTARFAVVAGWALFALVYGIVVVREKKPPPPMPDLRKKWRALLAGVGAAACALFGIATFFVPQSWPFDGAPFRTPAATNVATPLVLVREHGGAVTTGAIAVALAAALAAGLLWNWAKWWWIAIVSATTGIVMGAWVYLGAWGKDTPPYPEKIFRLVGSMWIPALFLAVLWTVCSIIFRPESRD